MKRNLSVLFLGLTLFAQGLRAAETPAANEPQAGNLEDQLQALSTPGNEAPAGLTPEKLYAVQNRYSPLRFRHEFAVGGSNNFSGDSFLTSQTLEASYRFYISNRWYMGLNGNLVFNSLTGGGKRIIDEIQRPADVPFTRYRADLLVGYHLFYGKLRFSMNRVFYFDQYVALGPGLAGFQNFRRAAAVVDAGLAFMFGKHMSFRVGFKDYYGWEQRTMSAGMAHNVLGYLQAGYVFGG